MTSTQPPLEDQLFYFGCQFIKVSLQLLLVAHLLSKEAGSVLPNSGHGASVSGQYVGNVVSDCNQLIHWSGFVLCHQSDLVIGQDFQQECVDYNSALDVSCN